MCAWFLLGSVGNVASLLASSVHVRGVACHSPASPLSLFPSVRGGGEGGRGAIPSWSSSFAVQRKFTSAVRALARSMSSFCKIL